MNKNLKVAFFVFIIIILLVFVFYYFTELKSKSAFPQITDTQRMDTLKKTSDIPPANPKMTDAQRLKLMNQSAK